MHQSVIRLFVLSAVLAMPVSGHALGGMAPPVSPLVLSVTDVEDGTLVISGRHFGDAPPTVRLADDVLVVKSASVDRIVADLPAGIRPATYRLIITAQTGRRSATSQPFFVALRQGEAKR